MTKGRYRPHPMFRIFLFATALLIGDGLQLAHADTLRVICSINLRPLVSSVVPKFEMATGNKVELIFDSAGPVQKRIEANESFDVVFVQKTTIQALAEANKLKSGSAKDVAMSIMVLFTKADHALVSAESLAGIQAALREAKSITLFDPSVGTVSGIVSARILNKAGLEAEMKTKTVYARTTAEAVKFVQDGLAEIGFSQYSEIQGDGLTLVRVPRELGAEVILSGAVLQNSQHPKVAEDFIRMVTDATDVIRQVRLEPLSGP